MEQSRWTVGKGVTRNLLWETVHNVRVNLKRGKPLEA
jgi:hypothetical protein